MLVFVDGAMFEQQMWFLSVKNIPRQFSRNRSFFAELPRQGSSEKGAEFSKVISVSWRTISISPKDLDGSIDLLNEEWWKIYTT